jgi:CHRD domain
MNPKIIAATATVFLLAAGAAQADILHFDAVLRGANETPPNAARGHGEVIAILDTDRRTLDYTVTYSGLSGPATTAGFQQQGAPATPAIATSVLSKGAEFHGDVQLNDTQVSSLKAGQWSFSISTMGRPGGEIGGVLKRGSNVY